MTESSVLEDVVTSRARRQALCDAGLWDETTLSSRVRHWAGERPDAVAVVDREGARRRTYADLDADVTRLAEVLVSVGVAPGDVVSVQLPNWYETVVADVAVQRAGGVINPLLPIYRRRELSHVFAIAHPKVLFTPSQYRGYAHRDEAASLIEETGDKITHVVVDDVHHDVGDAFVLGDRVALREKPGDRIRGLERGLRASAVSELIFTSGTESTPKAIMHTEQTASAGARAVRNALGLSSTDVVWMPSPIGHSTGFNFGVRVALTYGLPLVLHDRWDPTAVIDLLVAEGCTYTMASTTFLQDLVAEAERRDVELPSLGLFCCGGAPVPAALVQRAEARAIGVLRLYGSTEGLVVTCARPHAPREKLENTDGLPLDDVEVSIRDDAREPLGAAVAGEIFVRGPQTCVGFYDDPDRTAATFTGEDWVASGDLGVLDEDGYLTVVGRKKEIVIRGGMNIAPREIEELLLGFPEVDRVAVIGVPDERLGERVCACVVLTAGQSLSFEEMVARLRALGLATYKLPERLEYLSELPTTASGKVQKHLIRETIEA
jgi:acyl-CoA synthetase (AMP-forming)/AMP-acid ligase II